MKININRQLLGVEDFAWGEGKVEQIRGGQTVLITEINAGNLPFDESLTLKQVLEETYPAIKQVGDNIEMVTVIGDNILNINLIGEDIEAIKVVAREILSIVDVHLNMPNVRLTAQHSGHIEVIGNDLVSNGVIFKQDLGSITERVEDIPALEGRSAIVTVAENMDDLLNIAQSVDEINLVATHMDSVNLVGEDLMMVGLGYSLDAGKVTEPVDTTEAGISHIETVSSNIDSVNIDAVNIDSIIKVANDIDNVKVTGENISSVDIVGRDLTLSGFAYMMDCGVVNDPVTVVPQTISNIVTVADNIEDINAVALHIDGVAAIANDLATGTIGSKIDGGLIIDPVDSTTAGESNIEKVADNIADIIVCGQNMQTIIDGYNAAQLAIAAEINAQKWAEESFNVEVEPGAYSAKHWATVASNIVGAGVIDDTIIGLATTYSSVKIEDLLSSAVTDTVQINSPTEGSLAMFKDGAWKAVNGLDLGTL